MGVAAGLGLPVVEGVCSWERKSWRRRSWSGEDALRVRLLEGISRRRERYAVRIWEVFDVIFVVLMVFWRLGCWRDLICGFWRIAMDGYFT